MNSSSFINIGERTNVTGSAIFKKLIFEENYVDEIDQNSNENENTETSKNECRSFTL